MTILQNSSKSNRNIKTTDKIYMDTPNTHTGTLSLTSLA